MSFREAFEKYRDGTATEAEKAFVESEIEKNTLITDYLNEQSDFVLQLETPVVAANQTEIKKIKNSIRKKGTIIVAIAVGVILCSALLYNFAIARALNNVYYDPTKHQYSDYVQDFEVCLDAYTQMHYPEYDSTRCMIQNTGVGVYNMTIIQRDKLRGEQQSYSAMLDKSKLTVPFSFWAYPAVNTFSRGTYPYYPIAASDLDKSKEYLQELPGYLKVEAIVSFSRDLSMDELADLVNQSSGKELYFSWAGIRSSVESRQNIPLIGFEMSGSGPIYEKINSVYPDYELWTPEQANDRKISGPLYESHFKALLNFLSDNADAMHSLDTQFEGKEYYDAILDYVKSDGIKTYGLVVIGSPKDVLDFCNSNPVEQLGIKVWFK